LIGIFTLDLVGGLFITQLITILARRLQAFLTKAPPTHAPESIGSSKTVFHKRDQLRLLSFSVFVGILSHIGFDLISHDTNLLFYPWYENVRWFPKWWYPIWFEIPPLHAFGKKYSVGVFSIIWSMLTLFGTFQFFRFLRQAYKNRNLPE